MGADLQLCFLYRDLTVNPRALVSTHRLQMLFIEREQLRTCQDAQTLHRTAKHSEKQYEGSWIYITVMIIELYFSHPNSIKYMLRLQRRTLRSSVF